MSMLSNLDLVRRVPLFAKLSPLQAETMASAVTKVHYKRGEVVVSQGKSPDALFIILSGRARVLMTDNKDREVILSTLRAGDYVGEMSLIDGEPHSASVIADQPMDVLMLGRDEFMRCLTENTTTALAVMRGLVGRLRSADQKISSLALSDVYGRVANVLLEFAVPDDRGELWIREKISRQDIAKMVGASREMVSRVMKDFEEQGFFETSDGGQVRVYERRSTPR